MVSTLLVISGTLAALLLLLAVIVTLSARPAARRDGTTAAPVPGWVVDQGRRHPDAWAPLSNTSTEIPAVR